VARARAIREPVSSNVKVKQNSGSGRGKVKALQEDVSLGALAPTERAEG